MDKVLITGCAGFIGSTLAEACLNLNLHVKGVDNLSSYYSKAQKLNNLESLNTHPNFKFVERDIADGLVDILYGVDTIFHLAGQPGVRSSWRSNFGAYLHSNVQATQRLLEDASTSGVRRFIYSSSSSVYGNSEAAVTRESDSTQPYSPYGVTKLAAEHLCSLYAKNFGLNVVSLRYFTVYGPRQRPDMAIHRLIDAAVNNSTFTVYGDGKQVRDFTFVDDVVAANLAASEVSDAQGEVVNIAGGSQMSLRDLITLVGEVCGSEVPVIFSEGVAGDVTKTSADISVARDFLSWIPKVDLTVGLHEQLAWQAQMNR